MDPDAARAELGPVEDEVVGLGQRRLRGVTHVGSTETGEVNGWCAGDSEPSSIYVEDREVGDEQEGELVVTLGAPMVEAELAEHRGHQLRPVGDQ